MSAYQRRAAFEEQCCQVSDGPQSDIFNSPEAERKNLYPAEIFFGYSLLMSNLSARDPRK